MNLGLNLGIGRMFGLHLAGGGGEPEPEINGLLNNLVAYWGLDEAGGANNALDKHGNSLTLTQSSSPGSDTGLVYAGARSFDGSADYFSRTSETLLQIGDNDCTIVAWVYLTSLAANRTFVSKRVANYEFELKYDLTPDRFRFGVSNNGGTGASNLHVANADVLGTPSIDTWYMLAAQHDADNNLVSISVNVGGVTSAAHTGGIIAGTNALNVGRSGTGAEYVIGQMQSVAIWKSAAGAGGLLTAEQLTALYNGGAGLAYAAYDSG